MPALACAAIGDSLLNVVTGIWMARRLVDLPAHDATREVANVADEQQERSGRQGS
jgi:hypothetical protein